MLSRVHLQSALNRRMVLVESALCERRASPVISPAVLRREFCDRGVIDCEVEGAGLGALALLPPSPSSSQ